MNTDYPSTRYGGRYVGFRQADVNDPFEYDRIERDGETLFVRRPFKTVMKDFERITLLDTVFYGSPLGDRTMERYRKYAVQP